MTMVLEKTLESPVDSKEIKPVNPKENQSWIFIGRTDTEAEATILWPSDVKLLIGKDPDAGEDWRQEEKGKTETPVLEGTNQTLSAPSLREIEQWLHRKLNQSYLLMLEGLLWRCGSAGAQHKVLGFGSSCLGRSLLA